MSHHLPDNITSRADRKTSPPLCLYQITDSRGLIYSVPHPNTNTKNFQRVLEPNQIIVSIIWQCIRLKSSPTPIRPPSWRIMTTKMQACNPYAPYIPSPMMQQPQSSIGQGHKVVCAHALEPYGSTTSMNSNFGGSPANLCTPFVSPTYTASRPSSLGDPPPFHRHSCIPLPPLSRYSSSINPLLERGTTPPINYDIRSPPSFATSHRHLVDDDRWRYERASNPNLGSLTIRTALVSKPIVVFPSKIDDGDVTVQDVLLAVHYALRASALDDQHRRRRRRQAELWRQGAPRSYRPPEDYEAMDVAVGCYGWAGLTQSPTESDVWILMTT